MNVANDALHSRSLLESLMMPELIAGLQDWARAGAGRTLIGAAGLAFTFGLGSPRT
jgi:hypothetical protein